ncbi:tryptophan synthase subunit alpha, partial [Vibrio sp. 1291-1]|nr:tryptophan synthase subunit alpha [Vibrio sp. 1291-1]
ISGSAVVKIIEAHVEQPQIMLDKLSEFVSAMKAATQK